MIIKVNTSVYLDVACRHQADAACALLDSLDRVIAPRFPVGEVLRTDVNGYAIVAQPEEQPSCN